MGASVPFTLSPHPALTSIYFSLVPVEELDDDEATVEVCKEVEVDDVTVGMIGGAFGDLVTRRDADGNDKFDVDTRPRFGRRRRVFLC